jgi:heme-degrading monooxygenase HmoA
VQRGTAAVDPGPCRVLGWRPPSEEEAVIIRAFRPTIHPGKEREFETFLRETAVPLVSRQSGLVAQHVGKPRDPSSTEYLYVTVWEDVESIRAFAGERWQEAVIEPDEEQLLKDTWIGHYEVLRTSDSE